MAPDLRIAGIRRACVAMSTPIRTSIEVLLDRYPVLLLDASGVLIDAAGPLPGAVALIHRLNRLGTSYFVLTNDASRLPDSTAEYFNDFGLDIASERVITAGSLLRCWFAEKGLQGKRCMVLGPRDSERYAEDAGGALVRLGEPFEVLVIGDETGFAFLETIDTVLSLLCRRLGKPGTALFAEAERRAGTRDLVILGDQLGTDILGAHRFGIDSVLVGGGVTATRPEVIQGAVVPTYYLPSLES